MTPLIVARDKSKRAVGYAIAAEEPILGVAQRRAADDSPTLDVIYRVGVTASVLQRLTRPDGTVKLIVQRLERMAIVRFIEGDFLAAEVAPVRESRGQLEEAFTLSRAVFKGYQNYANVNIAAPPQAIVLLPPLIASAAIRSGEHVVHVGAGTGYYTAIMAHLAE